MRSGRSRPCGRFCRRIPRAKRAISGVLLGGTGLSGREATGGGAAFQFVSGIGVCGQVELLVARLQEAGNGRRRRPRMTRGWGVMHEPACARAQVEFQRALAAAVSGRKRDALQRFTNFVAQYPANDLAPQAQWWIGGLLLRAWGVCGGGNPVQQLFQTWKTSPLAYEARMMAGRAAVRWAKWDNAIEHFMSLTSDNELSSDLRMQALFARAAP